MSVMASQITSHTIAYSIVYSGADQRKHQSSASLAFAQGIHRWTVNFPVQRVSNAENVSIWWRHHEFFVYHSWRYIKIFCKTYLCGSGVIHSILLLVHYIHIKFIKPLAVNKVFNVYLSYAIVTFSVHEVTKCVFPYSTEILGLCRNQLPMTCC